MPSFIQLVQLILLFYITASTVSAHNAGDFNDADDEHKKVQPDILRVVRALRRMTDRSTPDFCSACSQEIGGTQSLSDSVQFDHAQGSSSDELTNSQKYFRANAQRIALEKYDGNPIPKEKQLAECTSLLRGNLLQHLRAQFAAFEFHDPKFDVFGMAYGNRNWAASHESMVVALQQFTTEVQYDSERYSCNKFQETKGARAINDVVATPSSSSSGPLL